jgi:hypothetical protein
MSWCLERFREAHSIYVWAPGNWLTMYKTTPAPLTRKMLPQRIRPDDWPPAGRQWIPSAVPPPKRLTGGER